MEEEGEAACIAMLNYYEMLFKQGRARSRVPGVPGGKNFSVRYISPHDVGVIAIRFARMDATVR